MNERSSLITKGIAGKMIKVFVIFALVMGLTFLTVFGIQLGALQLVLRADETDQLQLVAGLSKESLTSVIEENLRARIKWAADKTDDEFWKAGHVMKTLQNQVADIFRHPENYARRSIHPPRAEDAGVPSLQLLCPNGYENIRPEAMEKAERLANLEPLLREFLIKNDYNVDIGVATMDGLALDMDRLADKKIMEDGSIISLDCTEQIWYKGAIERGEVYFYPIHSIFFGFDEVAYAAPVYVDNELVAVLQGSLKTELFTELLEGRNFGKTGFTVLISDKGQLVCTPRETGELGKDIDLEQDLRTVVNPQLKEVISKGLSGETGVSIVTVDGEEYYAAYGYMRSYGWEQIIFVSVKEVMEPTDELLAQMNDVSVNVMKEQNSEVSKSALIAMIILIIILAAGIIIVSETAKRRALPLAGMADQVHQLSGDNMTFEVKDEYKTGDEIQVLAESFGALTHKMKDYVNEMVTIMSEKERVNTELSLATKIQADMLPSKFPAFPDRSEFNIYASMTPAKEVGGDFYDFFFAGDDRLAMVMADVSGKGVPAAMFMMMAKTMIQSQLVAHYDAKTVLENVNNIICSNNREKMFVTVWVGILDLKTGVMIASNAGHEYPIFKEPGGRFEIIKDKHGFVIGGKKNMKYTNYEIEMKPGSKLFVYTDGVPEAMNSQNELFGMERTVNALNMVPDSSPEEILAGVDNAVRDFVGGAEQFDDLTMLCIEYYGPEGPIKEKA
ncbi:MAG: SpoIIE family protein phosphatase [Lachnospiraceae bacterium]|nr:SpoIIE family protein phosphatase [Lachnospiraceae bacterium]